MFRASGPGLGKQKDTVYSRDRVLGCQLSRMHAFGCGVHKGAEGLVRVLCELVLSFSRPSEQGRPSQSVLR